MTRSAHAVLTIAGLVLMTACTTRVVEDPAAAVGPQLSVERFLQAANSRDLTSMGRLFGTEDGPIGDTGGGLGCAFKAIGSWFGGRKCLRREDVELRMDAIAAILRHEDYVITREEVVAGRRRPATRVLVDMVVNGQSVPAVPFVVVRSSNGRWLVEQVDLERVMSPG